ncbi:porin family protein [Pontibacter akesuensis]|uniref:Outer membrane protein beta-barrel domain-containing protein n=1 Tax=Pontibacter akesuensis TaxID=388950 RepID=A0A1I7K8X4_9BACT|nr:porin family protein [Pontibacter akesuensis]GHA74222.1 hypothetical protein GCM10007389_29850 [Pontibacter akesuensis]SFU93822.1 Outer membrane protein beta-barrel domain-containing protein [Pontibacter akesuensis]
MLKNILAIPLLLLALTAKGQDIISVAEKPFVPESAVGIRGGLNYTGFSFSPAIENKMILAPTGGLVFTHMAQSKLGVQVELNYVQRGWEETLDSTTSYTRRLNYLELPLMTRVALGSRNTRFILTLGPYASYMLSEKSSVDGNIVSGEGTGYLYKDVVNSFMYGLNLGIGVAQKTGLGTFQLESRVTHSLSNLFDAVEPQGLSSSKNPNIALTLSYLVGLGNRKK